MWVGLSFYSMIDKVFTYPISQAYNKINKISATLFICSCVGMFEGDSVELGASCNMNCVIFRRTAHHFLFM